MTTQRKPKAPTPEVDHGGRVYLVKLGKVWEGKRGGDCRSCPHKPVCGGGTPLLACDHQSNGGRGYRTLHPVQAVG